MGSDGLSALGSPYAWAPRKPLYEASKRALETLIAGLALLLLSPAWLAIAAAIRLSGPGPALYRATVVGRDGVRFTYFKFRTLSGAGDADEHGEWLKGFVAGAPGHKRVPPTVTGIGRLLRRSGLDEVPQMINVVLGQMALVGPRPPLEAEFAAYDDRARRRLAVRPGITGLFQVSARGSAPFARMVEIDLDYIARRSLALDLTIMARTLAVMAAGRGGA